MCGPDKTEKPVAALAVVINIKLHLEQAKIQIIPSFPEPLLGLHLYVPPHAAALGRRLFAVGGVGQAHNCLSSVGAFDPRDGNWACIEGSDLAKHMATVANNRRFLGREKECVAIFGLKIAEEMMKNTFCGRISPLSDEFQK